MMVPSAPNAARSLASDSTVVSGRMPSSWSKAAPPLLAVISTGTISSARMPSFVARAARCWERAANSSCSSRVMPSALLCRSVDSPIDSPSKASVSPSSAIESNISTVPYL